MTNDEIREAVKVVSQCTPIEVKGQNETIEEFRKSLNLLTTLAEQYLAVSGRLPDEEFPDDNLYIYSCAINDAVRRCALSILKALPEEREIHKIIADENIRQDNIFRQGFNACLEQIRENLGIKEDTQ